MLRSLKQPLQPITLGAAALHPLDAVANKLAQRFRRYVALTDEPVTQQIGDPLAVLYVGFRPAPF